MKCYKHTPLKKVSFGVLTQLDWKIAPSTAQIALIHPKIIHLSSIIVNCCSFVYDSLTDIVGDLDLNTIFFTDQIVQVTYHIIALKGPNNLRITLFFFSFYVNLMKSCSGKLNSEWSIMCNLLMFTTRSTLSNYHV